MEQELVKIIKDALTKKESAEYLDKSIISAAISDIKAVYAPIVTSLEQANTQNNNLLQEKLRLENQIIELKKQIEVSAGNSDDLIKEVINTCEKKRHYEKCEIWDSALKGCGGCRFYKSSKQHK